ncbi:MAG TPA: Hsp20/alpha crystallin family protein [Verrucomicrobiae bacterium]|nr:Hsp20/alpha crystallin family protein [Verrucomicrobiae bacterium]
MAMVRWTPRSDLWDPFASLSDIQDEMNRLFDTSLRRSGSRALDGAFFAPCDIFEEKDKLVIRMDLPGLRKDDVHVTLQQGLLTIKGERKADAPKDANYYAQERVSGTFTRTIQLPVSVEAGKIDASFRDGVLQVTLPKSEDAKPKQIEVKVG